MHPDLEKMIALQALDVEARRLNEEIAALPKRVAQLAAEGDTARKSLATSEANLAKEETLRRGHELEIKGHQQKSERLTRQMDVVTTTAQAAALEHEISFAKNEVSRLEDAELESLERTELLEAEKKDLVETVANLERRLVELTATTNDAVARDREALALVQAQRAELRPQIGENALLTYDRIAKSRGTALSEGVDQKCSACQMLVRPQRWNDLRDRSNDDQMLTCETCGRILYWDPARDAPQKKPAERSESLAAAIVRASL